MDRGAWQAAVHGVARVRHELVTKRERIYMIFVCGRSMLLILLGNTVRGKKQNK